jgi:energy-coupling factor transporter ATP-binding protein EcfA2
MVMHYKKSDFDSFERREDAFRNRMGALVPKRHGGPRLFWRDFKAISLDQTATTNFHRLAYITSNPKDCLAFATPYQILNAARRKAKNIEGFPDTPIEEIARRFKIEPQLHQPVRTLSGGESVKVALAKIYVQAYYAKALVIASPFSWLSQSNQAHFQEVCRHYQRLQRSVESLALIGEDSHQLIGVDDPWQRPDKPEIAFNLTFKGVHWNLSASAVDLFGPKTQAILADSQHALISPCLLVGENGEGKSMLARLLTRALAFQGDIQLNRALDRRPVHMLFQDVIAQTLLRSFRQIAGIPHHPQATQIVELYRLLGRLINRLLGVNAAFDTPFQSDAVYPSLLQTKVLLIAVRLSRRPGLLIMDEPDWGLSRVQAIAFLAATLQVAHELEVPLMLISHKPWWHSIARSCWRIGKDVVASGGRNPQVRFSLHTVARGELNR